jgi:hypothetical protein
MPIIYPDLRLDYKVATHPSVALVIIVGVLVFKPAGLSGRTLVARV